MVVHVARNGDWVEVTSRSQLPLTVLVYFDEPYLRIGPQDVEINTLAPTTHVNGGLLGAFGPAVLDTTRDAPRWRRVADGQSVRWHDLRVRWLGVGRPPEVAADPSHEHRISDWAIPVQVAGQPIRIEGSLTWLALTGNANRWMIWVIGADTMVLLTGLGYAIRYDRRRRRRLRFANRPSDLSQPAGSQA